MTGIKAMQDQIKEASSYDGVLILNWLPLAEEKQPGDEMESKKKHKKEKGKKEGKKADRSDPK